ncbi:hypothetical protein AAZX31_01G196400 [Glycine max]|uniref:Uncharacterized protein n=1 Tax=Glycine soja TaxID=3848 RepID=A0A445M618_GLYSO|nr:uncharacterized protein LOC102662187 [Glycine max]XP_028224169.1 uncharacterized protein LOC114405854 [Glycine soja]KAG4403886.1 hypothetical protein GLYMA_01G210300v4 [Glycine max]KAG5070128.1 hypothetical protein JHK85_002505 [Glycine max]KAG5089832.1 hypothetical protein JHK86_002444 [Glycine max]KAH1164164.1 hypothetical protein GYH30_002278 [Glycine max]KAH1267432.1 Root meristem growth factor 6 [Glycine max]
MTYLSLALLLLLCVSVHACTARSFSLSLTIKDTTHKELDKFKLLETLTATSSIVKNYKLEANQPQQQKVVNNEINTCESCSSVSSTLKETIVEAASVKIIPSDSGEHAAGTSFQMDSPSFLASQDERRHARSMLGPAQHNDEETVVTNASDTEEDIVEMDYAQPHRKPPIHNEKP